ncbi:MAG: hypothetical protein ACRBB6_15025 [Neptuniibacter sp.]
MSKAKYHEDVLEAIGTLGSKSRINNLLNKVYSHSRDPKLRDLVGMALSQLASSGINHSVITLRDSNAVPTKELEAYCRKNLGWQSDSGPLSKK